MEQSQLKAVVESLIFVSEEPLSDRQLLTIFEETGIAKDDISSCIDLIRESFNNNPNSGLQLVEVAGGYQFRTKESCAEWIKKLSIPKLAKLSQPALETLSIIAYRQPLVRAEIEEIRGVDVGAVLKTLLERELISIVGRREEPGQPLIYGTTQKFLELFGLPSLKDLPPLADIEELARRRIETEEREGELAPLGGEETDAALGEEDSSASMASSGDSDILVGIEQGIKDLRKLEREIFPKETTPEEAAQETNQEGSPADQTVETDNGNETTKRDY